MHLVSISERYNSSFIFLYNLLSLLCKWDAGTAIDDRMQDEGFNISINLNTNNGFLYGGNTYILQKHPLPLSLNLSQ